MFLVWIAYIFCITVSTVCSSENTTEATLLSNITSDSTQPADLEEEVEYPDWFKNGSCVAVDLPPEYYTILPNRFTHLHVFNVTINDESLFFVRDQILVICVEHIQPGDKIQPVDKTITPAEYLTVIGLGISMISLFLHLVVFSLVPVLRNLPGWNLAALCGSLLIYYSLFLASGDESLQKNKDACVAIASLTHFFFFASFLWMTIMSCDVFVSLLRATGSFRRSSTDFTRRKFAVYCLIAFGISFLFAIAAFLADYLDILPLHYRPAFHVKCWFSQKYPILIFFVVPVSVLTCINFLLFGLSSYIIHANKRNSNQDAQKSVLKKRYFMYYRLSVIMGVTWVAAIVANAVNKEWLWCVFIVLNTLQGFFIFLAFTCSEKVRKHFRQKFPGVSGSSETLTPTFQSYCSVDESTGKGLDKVVDSSKEKSDCTSIHL